MPKKKPEQSQELQAYLGCIAAYEREFKRWEARVERILKRYKDEDRPSNKAQLARFNILWSNVQTLVPACFSKLPQPDVSRRFKDQDPTGRVAAMVLERSLDFEIQHYADYRSTMRQCVFDRFLGGRGTAWIRYEPHFKNEKEPDGAQITEDTDEAPVNEAIDYECAPIDYVHWRDFGHDVARTWEEVTKVWRKVYMDEEAVAQRFGPDVAKKIPYDSTPEELKKGGGYKGGENDKKQACVYELWDKTTACAYWFTKGMPEILDEREDPLGLQDFFPCPRPLFATLTNESLVPTPDFSLYQDQAKSLDVLSDRIDGLVRMLQVKGVYDASADSSLSRLFTEGENGTLLPVKNWAQFAEKNGLTGQIDVHDITPIAQALKIASDSMEQVKSQVYEITGISDIIRGQTQASETATAQQIKGQYASLRLRSMQDEVARFATECLQLKAQVICGKFSPQTIAAIAAADQLSDVDKPQVYPPLPMPPQAAPMSGQPPAPPPPPQLSKDPVGPAMALLIGQERVMDPASEGPNPMRSFRIEVAADTLVQLDEQQEKQERLEFVTAVGAFIEKAAPVMLQAPASGPLIMTLLKFGVRAFKIGKQVEGQIDTAIEGLQKTANQGPPPDPKVMEEQITQKVQNELTAKNASKEIAVTKREADLDIREMKFQAEQELEKAKKEVQGQIEEQNQEIQKSSFENEKKNFDNDRKLVESDLKMKQDRAKFDEERSNYAQETLVKTERETKGRDEVLAKLVETITANDKETKEMMAQLMKTLAAPTVVDRDPNGRVKGARRVLN